MATLWDRETRDRATLEATVRELSHTVIAGKQRREQLEHTLEDIAAKARWYADNDQRDPHEVDHALCVEILDVAERALGGAA